MTRPDLDPGSDAPAGVRFTGKTQAARLGATETLSERLRALGLARDAAWITDGTSARLAPGAAARWTPGGDTLDLRLSLGLDAASEADLEREIVVAMLAAPRPLEFPGFEEFESSVRMRRDTAVAARLTALEFDTDAIERPQDCWTYAEPTGFTVLPGRCLIESLRQATQPGVGGRRYAFSCYRASEYVMLIGIAEEARRVNPAFLARLQARKERRAVQSGEFHDAFLREFGAMDAPLPPRWYVPGDRVWFRNPDERSADAEGYEGSWVIYVGGGRFANFWIPERPFTMTSKCVEIFHWRHATWRDAQGRLRIDEAEVERRVASTLADPVETAGILARMQRHREPRGVYRDGGCIDTTREFPRFIRPETCDMALSPG